GRGFFNEVLYMYSVDSARRPLQPGFRFRCNGRYVSLICLTIALVLIARSANAEAPTALVVPNSKATSEADMKPYQDKLSDTEVVFDMLPIRGGKFKMGSPDSEKSRKSDEGPVHEVEVAPFWMGKYEVTWDEYEVFMFSLDQQRRKLNGTPFTELDKIA